jgi:hypothetical protein
LKILDREGRDLQVVGLIIVCGVNLGPEWVSVGIQAWLFGLHPFAAFFLTVALPLAVDAGLPVLVGVAASTLPPGLVLRPLLLLVSVLRAILVVLVGV